jgi:two-component system phosphate regulon response regulator PhoB
MLEMTADRVLVVDDEEDIRELLDFNLREAGFEVTAVATGNDGLAAAAKIQPAVVVLDLMLPDISGTEVCRRLRADPELADAAVLMLTARGDEYDRVLGFEVGADDYVVKPFSLKELAARCKVALRRAEGGGEAQQGYRDENFEVDFEGYIVRFRGEEVRLTLKEFELFRYMVERPGRVVTRERLMERVWGFDTDVDVRSIDAHIRRLRAKLGPARRHVETVVGLGYRFVK